MVGFIGTLGDVGATDLDEHLRWSERESRASYDHAGVTIRGSYHGSNGGDHPTKTPDGDASVWLFGELYGYDSAPWDGRGYRPRPDGYSSEAYGAMLYAEQGIDFVNGVNGNFVAVIHDAARQRLYLVTDRLGSVPLFVASVDDGIAFSTSIQSLARHPAFSVSIDPQYIHEYFVFKRSFGTTTPIIGIERHQPGAVTTIDTETMGQHTRSFWRPSYDPRDRPFSAFVDRFVDIFSDVIEEWIGSDDRTYGLLLSGGSDSRLCLGAINEHADVTAFHMSGWMSREARMAERTALTADVEFQWLRRDDRYQRNALARNPPISNFNGWFSQAYVTGFEGTIVRACDVLVSGMYADTLFKGHAIPSPEIDLGGLGEFDAPIERSIESTSDYIDWLTADISDELDLPTDIRTVLEDNITAEDGAIRHHGVRYDSLDDLIHCGKWYPLANDDDLIFRDSLMHLRPYRTPYLDNRLIDLALEMPRKYQLRRNIVNAGLKRIAPDLAEIPHANSGIRPTRSFISEYVGTVWNAFWEKHIRSETPPKPHLSNGPWVDDASLIRTQDFAITTLQQNESLIRELPFLDWGDVLDCYHRHLDGENRIVELYGLLTFLEMPVTRQLVEVADATGVSPVDEEHRSQMIHVTPEGVGS